MITRQYIQRFEQLRREMRSALDDEISVAMREGGSSYVLFKGRHLSQYGDRHLYMLSADEDLRMPDGSQVILESDSEEVKDQLLGTEGFTLRIDETVYSPITGDLFIKKQRHTIKSKIHTVKLEPARLNSLPNSATSFWTKAKEF